MISSAARKLKPTHIIFQLLTFCIVHLVSAQRTIPDPYYPNYGEYVYSDTILFQWNASCGSEPYRIRVGTEPALNSPIHDQTTSGNSLALRLPNNGTYYYKVIRGTQVSKTVHFHLLSAKKINSTAFFGVALPQYVIKSVNHVTTWRNLAQSTHAYSVTSNTGPYFVSDNTKGDYLSFQNQRLQIPIRSSKTYSFCFLLEPVSFNNTAYQVYMGSVFSNVTGIRWAFGINPTSGTWGMGWHGTPETPIGFGNTSLLQLNEYNSIRYIKELNQWKVHVNNQSPRQFADNSFPTQTTAGIWTLGSESDQTVPNVIPQNFNLKALIVFDTNITESQNEMVQTLFESLKYPALNLGPDVLVNTTLTAKGFSSYLWSTGATSASIVPKSPGTYWLKATHKNGTVYYDSIRVLEHFDLKKPKTHVICSQDTIIWDTKLKKQDYVFTWNHQPLQNDSVYLITATGSYRLKVTDKHTLCTFEDSLHIETVVGNHLKDSLRIKHAPNFCTGDLLRVFPGDAVIQGYLWNTGSRQPTTSISGAGYYMVKVRAYSGCTAADTLYVNSISGIVPRVTFTHDTICRNQGVNFYENVQLASGSQVISKIWKYNTTFSELSSYIFTNAGLNKVSFLVTATGNCTASFTKNVIVNPIPVAFFVNTSACTYDTMNFANLSTLEVGTLSGNFWRWSNGLNSQLPNPRVVFTTPGVYTTTLTAMSAKGCASSPYVKSYVVKGGVIPNFTYDVVCRGRPVFFNETTVYPDSLQGIRRIWVLDGNTLTGTTQTAYVFTSAGLFKTSLIVFSSNGCRNSTTQWVSSKSIPVANFSFTGACLYDSLVLSDRSTLFTDTITRQIWTLSNGTTSDRKKLAIFVKDTTDLVVQYKVFNGNCSSEVEKKINIASKPKFVLPTTILEGEPPFRVVLEIPNTTPGIVYVWSTKNGETVTGPRFEHIFPEGSFTIAARATNIQGCSNIQNVSVNSNFPFYNLKLAGVASSSDGVGNQWLGVRILNESNRDIDSVRIAVISEGKFETSYFLPGKVAKLTDSTYIVPLQFRTHSGSAKSLCVRISAPVVEDLADNERCLVYLPQIEVVTLKPNPTTAQTYLQLISPANQSATVQIYAIGGLPVFREEYYFKQPGVYTLEIPTHTLSAGWYIVQVNSENMRKNFKLLKR